MTTTFVDISHHQGQVDLAAYAAAGYGLVAMKATEGVGYTDFTFSDRWKWAGRLGLRRIAYHFLRNDAGPAAQFDFFDSVVRAAGGYAPGDLPCVDVEDDLPGMVGRAASVAQGFCARAALAGQAHGWTYSYRYYLSTAGLTAAVLPAGWRNLWAADTTPAAIELAPGWTRDELVACQYTDHANLPGIPNTDADFLIKEWVDMTSPSNWSAADRGVLRGLIDERLAGWLAALATGRLNAVTGGGDLPYRDAMDALVTRLDPAVLADAVVAKLGGLGPLDAALVKQAIREVFAAAFPPVTP